MSRKICLPMGGKGGVGKTTAMTGVIEWYQSKGLPCAVLDFDTENKREGSLSHFFPDVVHKIDVSGRDGLDVLVDCLDQDKMVFADLGASSGEITTHWFNSVYADLKDEVEFIVVGVVTPDPASLVSVSQWGGHLQDRVKYLIVLNAVEDEKATFDIWESSRAKAFRDAFKPEVIKLESRNPKIQNLMREYGVTVGQVADRKVEIPELSKSSVVIRAQGYRRRFYQELDRIQNLFGLKSLSPGIQVQLEEKQTEANLG